MYNQQDLEIAFHKAYESGDMETAKEIGTAIQGLQQSANNSQAPLVGENTPIVQDGEFDGIPAAEVKYAPTPTGNNQEQNTDDNSTLADKAIGAGEAIASLGTASTTGALGYISGLIEALYGHIKDRTFGTPEAANDITNWADQKQKEYTYEPKTQKGQEYLNAIANAISPLQAFGNNPIISDVGIISKQIKEIPSEAIPPPTQQLKPTNNDLSTIIKSAIKGDTQNQEALAAQSKIDIPTIAASNNLGLNVPLSYATNNETLAQAIGAARSRIATPASVEFKNNIDNFSEKMNENINTLASSPNIAEMTQNLKSYRNDLNERADNIFQNQITPIMPKQKMTTENTSNFLKNWKEKNNKKLPSEFLKLQKSLNGDTISGKYEFGNLEKDRLEMSKAFEGDYKYVDAFDKQQAYWALRNDYMDNAKRLGGDKLYNAAQEAFKLKEQVHNLDKALSKQITVVLKSALDSGARGESKGLDSLLKLLPEDVQKEAIGATLKELSTVKNADGFQRFNFNSYAKLYQGLRHNAPIYDKVISIIGDDKAQMLDDLNKVSVAIVKAKSNISHTGKSLQLIQSLESQDPITTVLSKMLGAVSRHVSAGVIDLSDVLLDKSDNVQTFAALMGNREFTDLAYKIAVGAPIKEDALNAAQATKAYRDFTREVVNNNGKFLPLKYFFDGAYVPIYNNGIKTYKPIDNNISK